MNQMQLQFGMRFAVAPASWSAPAKRSDDGAFARTGREQVNERLRPHESDVAPRCLLEPKMLYTVARGAKKIALPFNGMN